MGGLLLGAGAICAYLGFTVWAPGMEVAGLLVIASLVAYVV